MPYLNAPHRVPTIWIALCFLIGALSMSIGCNYEGGFESINCGLSSQCPDDARCIDGYCVFDADVTVDCADGEILCDGTCIDARFDDLNCGSCDVACPGGEVCEEGSCVEPAQCEDPETACGSGCHDLNTDEDHCGQCNNGCALNEECNNGQCVCPIGFNVCDGDCVDLSTNTGHCLECGNTCDEIAAASSTCESNGCFYVCQDTDATLCDDEGVCADLNTDLDHCGACGDTCAVDGASVECIEGSCSVECNDQDATYCVAEDLCTDLLTDDDNCGECGSPCADNEQCDGSGDCECISGYARCNGICVNMNSPDHCGSCDNVCDDVEVCDGAGNCADDCPGDRVNCGGSCVNLDIDLEHCQGCDNNCNDQPTVTGASPICTSTGCDYECDDGSLDLCADQGLCTDTDLNHCGSCTTPCTSNIPNAILDCSGGNCTVSCPGSNETACEAQGVCTNTDTDDNNCGTCGNECTSPDQCQGGTCNCVEVRDDATVCSDQVAQCGSVTDVCNNTVDCDAVAGCSGGDVCDTDNNQCVGCFTTNDCDGDDVCDTNNNTCVGCLEDTDCDNGVCDLSDNTCDPCPDGETYCEEAGGCVDLQSDDDYCGACENNCTSPDQCIGGGCECVEVRDDATVCSDQNAECGTVTDVCNDPVDCDAVAGCSGSDVCDTDNNQCFECLDNGDCDNGTCAGDNTCDPCPDGETYCEEAGGCVDTDSDEDHCGECDNSCHPSESCSDGECS